MSARVISPEAAARARELVATWPPITDEQVERVVALLQSARPTRTRSPRKAAA